MIYFKVLAFLEFFLFAPIPVGNRAKVAANSRINFGFFTANVRFLVSFWIHIMPFSKTKLKTTEYSLTERL